jgi:hypothetical protein
MQMKTKTIIFVGIAAITSTIVGLALATPIFDLAAPILATGIATSSFEAQGAGVTAGGTYVTTKLMTDGPTTIFIQDVAYSPGGHTVLALSLSAGSLEWYNGNCEQTVYKAGDAWTEGSQLHYFRNVGGVNVHLLVTYIIPKGAVSRIDKPAPACAAALGLE